MSSLLCMFFFKQKTAYDMRISDWSSDVCSSDLSATGFNKDIQAWLYTPRVKRHPVTAPVGNSGLTAGAPLPTSWHAKIGRASCRHECVSKSISRWSLDP